jgi:hypothetical protein
VWGVVSVWEVTGVWGWMGWYGSGWVRGWCGVGRISRGTWYVMGDGLKRNATEHPCYIHVISCYIGMVEICVITHVITHVIPPVIPRVIPPPCVLF